MEELRRGNRKNSGWESPNASPANENEGWGWKSSEGGIARVAGGNHQMRRAPIKMMGGNGERSLARYLGIEFDYKKK